MKPRFENKIAEGKRTDGVDFMIHKWETFYPDFVAIIRGVTTMIEQIIVENKMRESQNVSSDL